MEFPGKLFEFHSVYNHILESSSETKELNALFFIEILLFEIALDGIRYELHK